MLLQNDPSEAMAYYVGENVIIATDVVVASGVVLEAIPGSRLVIESGVCLGVGVIVQAWGGELILQAGASLGEGVLLVGAGIVGYNACIGAKSTLIHPDVAVDQVVPARSLLGDTSPSGNVGVSGVSPPPRIDSVNGQGPATTNNGASTAAAQPLPAEEPAEQSETSPSPAPNNTVYGRSQVMQLVNTLFPHRNATLSQSDSS